MKKTFKILLGIVVLIIFAAAGLSVFYNYNLFNSFGYDDERRIHISIDDTIELFQDLTKNEESYTSIFDNYELKYCKKLHDEYGMEFSFYCFYKTTDFTLASATTKFKNEFEENSSWLKFNYNAYDDKQDLNEVEFEVFKEEYDTFLNDIKNIVGEKSLDAFTRLRFFHGTKEICEYMKSNGTLGFYAADDNRASYYLSDNFNNELKNKDYIKDMDNDLFFVHTDLRLDNESNVFFDLFKLRDSSSIEIFTHEWLINKSDAPSVFKLSEVARNIKTYGGSYTYSLVD